MKTSIEQTVQINGNLKTKPQNLSEIFDEWINTLNVSGEFGGLGEGNKSTEAPRRCSVRGTQPGNATTRRFFNIDGISKRSNKNAVSSEPGGIFLVFLFIIIIHRVYERAENQVFQELAPLWVQTPPVYFPLEKKQLFNT